MLQNHDQRTLVAQLLKAQDQASQLAPLSAQAPDFDIEAAYAVAEQIHQARLAQGDVAAGRKIGFTNAAMWAKFGVQEPVWGHMYARTVVHLSGASETCSLRRFAEPKIEPEIALHFHRAPPPQADINMLLDCIDWIAPSFEIVQSHYPDWQFKAADTIADGGLHGMLFVGTPATPAQLGPDLLTQLSTCTVTLACNGLLRETGAGKNALGNPLAAMAHLLAVLARQTIQRPIQAGEIVTTGTLTAPHALTAGETWRMTLQGIALAALEVQFNA